MSRLEGIFSPSIFGMPHDFVSGLPASVRDQFSRLIHRQLTRPETLALCALLALPPTIHFLLRMAHNPGAGPGSARQTPPLAKPKQVVVPPGPKTYGGEPHVPQFEYHSLTLV